MRRLIFFILLIGLVGVAAAQPPQVTTALYDMRGDSGLLETFGPRGVAWMPDGHLFVVDRRYNVFHIFDDQGRRFRLLEYPQTAMGACFYNGVARLNNKPVMYAIGSHYHAKNDDRYLSGRSVVHKLQMAGEGAFTEDSCKVNLDPDTAFRATGYYGDSAKVRLEVSGIAMDPAHNRVYVGCSQPLTTEGTVMVWQGRLDKFIAGDKTFRFEAVKTGLKPEVDPTTNTPYFLSDLEYIEGKGLVLLMTCFSGEDNTEQLHFGANQLWYMPAGFGPARPMLKGFAPGNRATGVSVRPQDKFSYEAAVVCDNDMEDTKIPCRTVIVRGLTLPAR